ncbi:hypothetical protein D4764_09G0001520 [Takifugu flavidus]|uniref:Uncharacterized protein n=1 Tax=Takifugu flavidus TaxID=433684 RepID=A0A5C6MJR1_9TELE|nr:hypothetical protein D4764_09G0001520 [Takifugu flavidus]
MQRTSAQTWRGSRALSLISRDTKIIGCERSRKQQHLNLLPCGRGSPAEGQVHTMDRSPPISETHILHSRTHTQRRVGVSSQHDWAFHLEEMGTPHK